MLLATRSVKSNSVDFLNQIATSPSSSYPIALTRLGGLKGTETVEHLLCECESLTMSWGRIFGQSFGELHQLSHVPLDLFRLSWEVIDREAQKILEGRSVLDSNDHPIKT